VLHARIRDDLVAGGAHMSDGRDVLPGDEVVADPSMEHDFVIEGTEECLFAVRAAGIVILRRPAG
jgi:hypothetical protein